MEWNKLLTPDTVSNLTVATTRTGILFVIALGCILLVVTFGCILVAALGSVLVITLGGVLLVIAALLRGFVVSREINTGAQLRPGSV